MTRLYGGSPVSVSCGSLAIKNEDPHAPGGPPKWTPKGSGKRSTARRAGSETSPMTPEQTDVERLRAEAASLRLELERLRALLADDMKFDLASAIVWRGSEKDAAGEVLAELRKRAGLE